jgi:hypothetical protein
VNSIKESDWKLFRQYHPIAVDRFCQRILKDAEAIVSRGDDANHKRYLELYKLVTQKDQDVGRLFNDFRRSTALIQLTLIVSESLLTEEEIAQFSPETQTSITHRFS